MELTEIQKKLLAISKPRSEEAIKKAEERKRKRAMKKELKEEVSRYLDSIVEWGQVEDEDDPDYLMSKSDLMKFAYHFVQWQKKQIMKDVVLETSIIKNDDGCAEEFNYIEWLEYENNEITIVPEWCKEGDKVKFIIIKEK